MMFEIGDLMLCPFSYQKQTLLIVLLQQSLKWIKSESINDAN